MKFTIDTEKIWKAVKALYCGIKATFCGSSDTSQVVPDKFTTTDIGRYVNYRPQRGPVEKGRIKLVTDMYVFVVYKCGDDWIGFQNYTGVATHPEFLTFA